MMRHFFACEIFLGTYHASIGICEGLKVAMAIHKSEWLSKYVTK